MNSQQKGVVSWIRFLALGLSAITVNASVIPLGVDAFPVPNLTFTGLAENTEVNGLSVDGVSFSYSLGSGNVIINGGPGVTNNISEPNIVSVGNAAGRLSLNLPGFFDKFGYGYAILSTAAVSNATTITLFSGTTEVGSLSYDGVPDPIFTGGFAGIKSTVPFDTVAIRFDAASPFALDNIRMAVAEVPEPSYLPLLGAGTAGLLWRSRRRRSSRDLFDQALSLNALGTRA
jgi:hypothetical protein